MTAIDISETFIKFAKETEKSEPLGINYQTANAVDLPFPDSHFQFVMATMSLMDMADHKKALTEIFRVLKSNGFFQFSISHPFFTSQIPWRCRKPQIPWRWIRDDNDIVRRSNGTLDTRKTGFVVSGYFERGKEEIEEWIFGAAPEEMTKNMNHFKTPRFDHTLSDWLNLLIKTGFELEEFCEPYASDEVLKKYPEEYDTRIIPFFLLVRCRK
jgi:SAM-dependent methyltransferase